MSNKTFNISILSGDGIGPEVMAQAILVLESVSDRYDFNLSLDHQLVGESQSMRSPLLYLMKL